MNLFSFIKGKTLHIFGYSILLAWGFLFSFLSLACNTHQQNNINQVVESKVDDKRTQLTKNNYRKKHPLHYTARCADSNSFQEELNKGYDLNKEDCYGNTVFYVACMSFMNNAPNQKKSNGSKWNMLSILKDSITNSMRSYIHKNKNCDQARNIITTIVNHPEIILTNRDFKWICLYGNEELKRLVLPHIKFDVRKIDLKDINDIELLTGYIKIILGQTKSNSILELHQKLDDICSMIPNIVSIKEHNEEYINERMKALSELISFLNDVCKRNNRNDINKKIEYMIEQFLDTITQKKDAELLGLVLLLDNVYPTRSQLSAILYDRGMMHAWVEAIQNPKTFSNAKRIHDLEGMHKIVNDKIVNDKLNKDNKAYFTNQSRILSSILVKTYNKK